MGAAGVTRGDRTAGLPAPRRRGGAGIHGAFAARDVARRVAPDSAARILLRRTSAADVPALVGVLASNLAELPLAGIAAGHVDRSACAGLLAAEMAREHATCLTLIERATGRAIGLAILVVPNPADRVPWISLLIVAADRQNLGLGTEAARALERNLAADGWHEVRLGVIAGNCAALRFWKRLGFRELPGGWRAYNGTPRTTITLSRRLPAGPGARV